MKSGIYGIKNIVNDKIYIGSSKNVKKRWYYHKYKLKKGTHPNKRLENAWKKYGVDSFIFIIIELIEQTNLIEREQYYIDYYDACSRNCGYNLTPTAGSSLGYKHSEETKQKISDALSGRKSKRLGCVLSEETKKKMSESAKKKPPISEETKKKLSIARMGNKNACRIVSDEERKKISESHIGINRGEKNGMAITNRNEVIAMRNDYDNGMTISEIMIKYGKKNSFTYQIVKRLRWKWLD